MGLRQTLVPNSLVLVEGTDPKGPRQDAPALGINASSAHGGEGSLMCGPGLHTCPALAQITACLLQLQCSLSCLASPALTLFHQQANQVNSLQGLALAMAHHSLIWHI